MIYLAMMFIGYKHGLLYELVNLLYTAASFGIAYFAAPVFAAVFSFIDISKSNTKLEQKIYEDLKKHSTNSYLIRDDYFCKELTKDVNLINTKRKNHITDTPHKNPAVYEFDIKRYVGYNKKTYFWKKKNKKEKKKKEKI